VAVESYFLSCSRYIERNPVTAGLVAEPWQYRWSSCPAYALGVADPLLSYNVWYQDLGANAEQRQQRARRPGRPRQPPPGQEGLFPFSRIP
jgi:putative transposase